MESPGSSKALYHTVISTTRWKGDLVALQYKLINTNPEKNAQSEVICHNKVMTTMSLEGRNLSFLLQKEVRDNKHSGHISNGTHHKQCPRTHQRSVSFPEPGK